MWPFTGYPELSASQVGGKTYDYIINIVLAGGTAGCVLASRLSEDHNVSVLVVEKGHVKDNLVSRMPLMSQNFWLGDPLQVELYFRKSENAAAHPGSVCRGHDGLINIQQSSLPFKWFEFTKKAARNLGLPVEEDCNDPTSPAMGLFHLDMAIDERGRRVSAYRAFLNNHIAIERKKHLFVCTGVVASRLDVDNEAGIVRGVYIRPVHQSAGRLSTDVYVKARREVIVCSGAICSPALLMLSVGTTLQDHCSFAIMMEFPSSETLTFLESVWGLWHIILWFLFGKGLFAIGSTPPSIFIRTTAIDSKTMSIDNNAGNMNPLDSRNIPDVEIMIQPVNSLERHVPGRSLMSFYPTLVQPFSIGSVELAEKDPLANPRINHPLLRDSRDLIPMRHAARFTMKLAEEFQNSGYPFNAPMAFAPGVNLNQLEEWEMSGPNALTNPEAAAIARQRRERVEASKALSQTKTAARSWKTVTDDEIDDYVRRVAMGSLHVSCTCPMSNDAKSGVVDQQLRVHGMRNLRVADASVFRKILNAYTMAPTIMVAERCADFIKSAWKER
ncbi:hypothetical protein F5Y16DRAFT_413562 [Xylariaceae sp. FL0255]|nr:hypothetical protein F5Y16DRAFT_413562 [Xylariaceae sp. FL0255]